MNVIVDTSVWSRGLRRTDMSAAGTTREVAELIHEGRVVMLGPIRQELLSGVREEQQFTRLRDALRPFSDHRLSQEDFETAAACFNRCRRRGIQGSNTDFLICAVASRNRFEVFTRDLDFDRFRRVLGIKLYSTRFR